MKVLTKLTTLWCALVISIAAFTQSNNSHNINLGFNIGGGVAPTETATLIDGLDKLQVQQKFMNSWAPSVYIEQRVFNSIGIKLGASYMNRNYNYWDISTNNTGYGDAYTDEYSVQLKMKYLQADFGLFYHFYKDAAIRPYIGSSFSFSAYNNDSIDFQETNDNETTVYQTKVGFGSTPYFGITPEIGVTIPTENKGEWVFGLKYHFAFENLVNGEYASYNTSFTDANFSSIEASGNYVHLTIGYQFQLASWEQKDKSSKKAKKAEEKRRSAEEKAAKEKAKQDEKLAKEKAKAEKDAQKEAAEKAKKEAEEKAKREAEEKAKLEAENKDKLKTDATGKPKELKGRSIKVQEEFEITTLEIELEMWDDGAEIDGDSIMVFFNGEWIATDVGLTKSKQSISLTLNPKGKNYLIVYAINEGEHPPNTCAISFHDGVRERKFRIHSKINENGAVSFKYKAP